MFEGPVKIWWKSAERLQLEGRGDNAQINWEEFVKKFYDQYFTERFRGKQASNFDELVQGSMGVTQYEAKFIELSRFAPDRPECIDPLWWINQLISQVN